MTFKKVKQMDNGVWEPFQKRGGNPKSLRVGIVKSFKK
jgi:hypothetical protein